MNVAQPCRDVRCRLRLPVSRWTPKVLSDVLADAALGHGWPAADEHEAGLLGRHHLPSPVARLSTAPQIQHLKPRYSPLKGPPALPTA